MRSQRQYINFKINNSKRKSNFAHSSLLHSIIVSMHFLSFIISFFFIAIIQSESTLNCEELGFTDKLECSSCDKLSAYVLNDGIRLYTVIGWIYSIDLIDECQKCCHDTLMDEKVCWSPIGRLIRFCMTLLDSSTTLKQSAILWIVKISLRNTPNHSQN